VGKEAKPYLTFRVARQELAMEAARVRGILPLSELEPLPGEHPGLLGITSLLGHLIGVIDLRSKLRLPHASKGNQSKIVVLEVTTGDRSQLAGFVADRISDVVIYRDRDLRCGALRGKGRPRKLVDFDQLVTEGEMAGIWALTP
jgi:chemotaxis signal transduction protein